jgi:hypothetical protein
MATKKKPTKKTATSTHPKALDENTSALVLAEYMVIGNVTEKEIAFIEDVGHNMSIRELALTFRIAEVLRIEDAFKMAPKFCDAFDLVRLTMRAVLETNAETGAAKAVAP